MTNTCKNLVVVVFAFFATVAVPTSAQTKDAGSCCSWSPYTECGDTTEFCRAQNECENQCGGTWVVGGFGSGGNNNNNGDGDGDGNGNGNGNANANLFGMPSICTAPAGVEAAHACLDWNAGSSTMEAAAAAYAERASLSLPPIFGVGSVGHHDSKHNMGKCFEFILDNVDRPLVFQAINEGGDVASGNIDLQQAAGGEGAFLGCTNPSGGAIAMFPTVGAYPSVFGKCPFCGGPETKLQCRSLPQWAGTTTAGSSSSSSTVGESLADQCEASFDLNIRLEPAAAAAAGDSNPRIVRRKWIPCPQELVSLTGLKRTDDPADPVDQQSALSGNSHATRMLDCCKPSAGWVGNVYNVDPNFPAVMPCKSDGFTRLDGSPPPFTGGAAPDKPTTTTTTTAAAANPTTPVAPSPPSPPSPTTPTTPPTLQPTTENSGGGGGEDTCSTCRVKGRRPVAAAVSSPATTPLVTPSPPATTAAATPPPPPPPPAPATTTAPTANPGNTGGCVGKNGAIAGDGCSGNPFLDWPDWYVNPTYDANIAATLQAAAAESMPAARAALENMRAAPSAYWLDVKRKVQRTASSISDTNHAHGILADARARGGKHVVFMVYDLPNRDCHAKASNGQICCAYNLDGTCNYLDTSDSCAAGLREYSTTYIDPLVDLLAEYSDVPTTLVIEPDSLPNLATNNDDPRCGNVATKAAYMKGVAYAVDQLATKTSAVIYIDGAHGGWLGWPENAEAFAVMINEMDVAQHVRGFATNVANYQPVGNAVCKASVAFNSDDIYKYCSLEGKQNADPCCADACGLAEEWNSGVTELNYVAILARVMSKKIPGFDPRFIIDTGRNGVADMRDSCSNWCNIRDAGVGQLPTAEGLPDPRVDALFWLKTPGESDGCTQTLPDGNFCPRFDSMCASDDSLGSMQGEPRAPEAGHWFEHQILQLAANANLDGELSSSSGSSNDRGTFPPTTTLDAGGGGGGGGGTSCAEAYGQCGGNNHVGPTCCVSGYTCTVSNEWYSQCIPA